MSKSVWCATASDREGIKLPPAVFTSGREAERYLATLIAADIDELIRHSPRYYYDRLQCAGLLSNFDVESRECFSLRKSSRGRLITLRDIYSSCFVDTEYSSWRLDLVQIDEQLKDTANQELLSDEGEEDDDEEEDEEDEEDDEDDEDDEEDDEDDEGDVEPSFYLGMQLAQPSFTRLVCYPSSLRDLRAAHPHALLSADAPKATPDNPDDDDNNEHQT